jgi:transposase
MSRVKRLEKENAELRTRVAELEKKPELALARIEELEEKLRQSSRNSSRPPSKDPPSVERSSKPPSEKEAGGQPGHDKHERRMSPPEKVARRIVCRPSRCRGCGGRAASVPPC